MTTLLLLLAGCELLPFLSDDALQARFDLDNDGVARPDDCDDNDPNVGIVRQYADVDEDGFGFGVAIEKCGVITGYAMEDGDCDDQDADVNPSAEEICDGIDNDCDEGVDVDPIDGTVWYADSDEDEFGDAASGVNVCEQPDGYVLDATDCDDQDADVNPDAIEYCDNGIDEDCNGVIDTDAAIVTWHADADNDTYGDSNTTIEDCAQPEGYVADNTDCDDTLGSVNPGAEEVCDNGIDDDCDNGAGVCGLVGDVLTSSAGAIITGNANGDYVGWNVSLEGDFNGDASADIVVTSPYHDESTNNVGAVCIFFTAPEGITTCTDADNVIVGTELNADFGKTIASADFDADGSDEVAIGAPLDDAGSEDSGAVYIFQPSEGTQTSSDATTVVVGNGTSHTFGNAIAVVRVPSEETSIPTLLIGAYSDDRGGASAGAAYIVNPAGVATGSVDEIGVALTGAAEADSAGASVASSDLDGDGVSELLVGSPGNDSHSTNAGTIHGIFGPVAEEMTLTDADFMLFGSTSEERLGSTMRIAGDVNEDGIDDLLIGSYQNNVTANFAGAAYILFSPFSSGEYVVSTAAELTMLGEQENDYAGYSVAGGADLSGDGIPDHLIGAHHQDRGGTETGTVYLVSGSERGTVSLADADAFFLGTIEGLQIGLSIDVSGDVDADGINDVLIGSLAYEEESGAAYFFYGSTGL